MRFARLSLFACGLLLATVGTGRAQEPAAPPIPLVSPTAPANPAPSPTAIPVPGPTVEPAAPVDIPRPPAGPVLAPPVPASASPSTNTTPPPIGTPGVSPLPPTQSEKALPGLVPSANPNDANTVVDVDRSVILDNADTFSQTEQGKFTGTGNVKVRYQGYTLTGDRVDVDTDRGLATFTGNVHLLAPNGQKADAGQNGVLRVNLRRGTYTLTGARSVVQPEETQLGLILPVYVYGGVVRGRPGFIDARGGRFTTCDFLDPHYSFGAREIYLIPGKRIVGRNVSFYRKDRRLFTIPYFVAPLDQRLARQTIFPQVGQTPDEGYFIKFAFGYALAASLPGILRIDEFQKKGTGLGFDQSYGDSSRPQRGSGTASIYRLYDRSRGVEDVNGSINHVQQFGTISAALNSQFQQNSYYAGLSKSLSQNTSLNLSRAVGNVSTSLLTTLTQNSFGLGRSQTLTSSLDNTYRPTGLSSLETRFDFSQNQSPGLIGNLGASDRQELDSNLDYRQTSRVADFELLATKYTQLKNTGGSSQFFGGLERLPEFRIATDALRLAALSRFLPKTTRLDLSLGAFNEPSSLTSSQRARFNFDLGTTTQKLSGRSTFDYGGSFQQGFYGNDTAQYVLNGRTAYRLRIGTKSTLGATYTYLRPYGYTPYQFDYAGSTNLVGLNLAVQERRSFRLSVGTGYDLNRLHPLPGFRATPYQTLSTQALYTPSAAFAFRTTTSYDLNTNRLLDLTNTLRLRGTNDLSLDASGRFSPTLHRYTTINGSLSLPFLRDPNPREESGYRLRAIGGYNGITSRFDYKGLALTRSWHDYELSAIYQDVPNGLRPGSTFTLNFRLKAFPAYEPFATGQYGQALDTGIGETL